MFRINDTGSVAAVSASLGGGVIVLAALLLATYQPEPTLVDRALPLLALSIWILALRTRVDPWREPLLSLIPATFAVEVMVPNGDLRLLLLGASVGIAATVHLAGAAEEWAPSEMFTALAILAPMRLVAAQWEPVLIQTLLVAGAVALWREIRTGGARLVYTAAAVLLLTVTLPADSLRIALVPWVILILVIAIRRESWVLGTVVIGLAALLLKWLGAAVAVIIAAIWAVARVTRKGSPAFLPAFQTTFTNIPAVVASPPFFPALYRSRAAGAAVIASVALALLVRPSLAAPIVAVGIVAACALPGRRTEGPSREIDRLDLSALILVGMILLFLPWSGAIVSRPPAPLPLLVVLLVAAVALLPASVRVWSGIAGAALFAVFLVNADPAPDQRRLISRNLAAGEQMTIPVDGDYADVELWIAGANLGDARPGHPVARIEVLDADGRGYSRTVSIGEIADWGAFRPDHVLGTQNVRPDEPAVVEGLGAGAWIRGTGRVPIAYAGRPRWVVVTGSSELGEDESIIIEELRFR